MTKIIWRFSTISAFISVLIGAFSTHVLSNYLQAHQIKLIEKAAMYQMYHSLALFGLSIFYANNKQTILKWSSFFFMVGIILFSGCLYIYSVTEIKFFVHVVPFGGSSFMIGWLLLAFSRFKKT